MLKIKNLQTNIPLAPYTTYKIGGLADYFFIAKTKEDLISAVVEVRKSNIPYFILGSGANILIGDKGFRGLVIKNETNSVSISGNTVTADSGVIVADLIEVTKDKNLSGMEHFAGIPSTIGGALWQNLHFLSPSRKETVFIDSIFNSAEILDENNEIQTVNKDFFKFGYDESILHNRNLLVTEATFTLTPKDKESIQKQIEENLRWRSEKQPQLVEFPSCGSVFKKIEGVGAGRLIEKARLKGYKIGGAQVSEKHANYIVNIGGATARDVSTLISLVKLKVKEDSGYNLELEIKLIGEF